MKEKELEKYKSVMKPFQILKCFNCWEAIKCDDSDETTELVCVRCGLYKVKIQRDE